MNKQSFLACTGALLLMIGCARPDHDAEVSDVTEAMQTLTGEVIYSERRYVPPGAELQITLEDSSKVGAPSGVVATSTTMLAGAQPYRFTLDYSPADIDANVQYNLRATISFYGDLLFTSTRRVDPFEHPEDTITLQVTMLGASGQ